MKFAKIFQDSKKNLAFEVFLFLSVALVFHIAFQIKKNKLASAEVCDLLNSNYLEGLTSGQFQKCLKTVSPYEFNEDIKIDRFNDWLKQFHISHLYIYNAKENQKMWEGQSRETGLIAKKIFNNWKITEVLVESPIKPGDVVLKINGQKIKSSFHILSTEGEFTIVRNKVKMKFNIPFSDVVYDERIKTKVLNSNWTYIKVPSFKSEFFGYDELARIYEDIHSKNLLIDIRDNLGGNFISIIRLLSMFKCEEIKVGTIFHNRTEFNGEAVLRDELSDAVQIEQVTQSNPVYLKLIKTELCAEPKKIAVVMNEKTSSVSELFVKILKSHYPNLSVFGTNTAGQMVLSIWFPLKYLGPRVMLSIPYAWATGVDQEIIEGMGISPTETIDLKNLQKYSNSLDPLLDLIIEKENIQTELWSSLKDE